MPDINKSLQCLFDGRGIMASKRPFADEVSSGRVEPGNGEGAYVVLLGERTKIVPCDGKRR